MATHFQIHLSDPGTVLMVELWKLHGLAMTINIFVMFTVAGGLGYVVTNRQSCRTMYEAPGLEVAWTVLPAALLFILAIPSLRLLYAMDEVVDPSVTVKAVGHQWYWEYQYGDFGNFSIDSYMVPDAELPLGSPRLLEVTDPCVLPMMERIRMIVTSRDVIHSFAVPALACKADGVPGRLNQIPLTIQASGVYYGMCSELCGVGHGVMPIKLEVIGMSDFVSWAEAKAEESELGA